MIGAITLLPLLAFLAFCAKHGPRKAIVWIAIPSLLLLPNYYTWKVPGIPRIDFHGYMLLAAAAALAARAGRGSFRLHVTDLLVGALLALVTISELENKGMHEARNLLALSVMGIGAPYVIGRLIARESTSLLALTACIVLLAAVIGTVAPWEARMGRNPFDFLRPMWPGAVPWDGALYRAGIRRVAGPFAHPICHGFFFQMVIPLAIWLTATKLTAGGLTRKWLVLLPLVGLAVSVSRGPILGLLIALWVMGFGWTRNRGLWLGLSGLAGLVVLAFTFDDIHTYLTVERGRAVTESQETAAYRNEMLDRYVELVHERPGLGYGKDSFPVLEGLKSIDNQYLFLALTHGVPASIAFLLMMLVPVLASARRLLTAPRATDHARLRWALVGVLCGAIFTQVTVFSGTQTTQVLLLLEGVTVGLLRSGSPVRAA
jgi:hypothetical protein